MNEIVVNLHIHTRFSDGTGSHGDICRAALKAGLDAILLTDHNVWIDGLDRYLQQDGKRLLILVGEELHDRARILQKNHLLVFGVRQELAPLANDIEVLLAAVRRAGGIAFVAHPVDPPARAFREPDISWLDWSVSGLTGIELWNGFSELKAHIPTKLHGIFYAFFPQFAAHGPLPDAVTLWDRLLASGLAVAVGGSDAHALQMRSMFLRRTVFPYDYHFRAVNTHVLLEQPLTGDVHLDAGAIYAALAAGRCFIGNDLPRPTRGFRFSAHGSDSQVTMGGRISVHGGVALQATIPHPAEIRLRKDGQVVRSVQHGQALAYRALEPGVYRVEAYLRHLGRRRAWIFSNPICVGEPPGARTGRGSPPLLW
jgi:hypothetical protein